MGSAVNAASCRRFACSVVPSDAPAAAGAAEPFLCRSHDVILSFRAEISLPYFRAAAYPFFRLKSSLFRGVFHGRGLTGRKDHGIVKEKGDRKGRAAAAAAGNMRAIKSSLDPMPVHRLSYHR